MKLKRIDFTPIDLGMYLGCLTIAWHSQAGAYVGAFMASVWLGTAVVCTWVIDPLIELYKARKNK